MIPSNSPKFSNPDDKRQVLLVEVAFHFELEAAAVLQQVVSGAEDGVRGKVDVCGFGGFTATVPRLTGQTLRSKDIHLLQVQRDAVQQAHVVL